MTDHDAALRLDQALDGASIPNLNGTEPLLETAHTLQARFEQTRAIPSEEFVMQLENMLFPTTVAPTATADPHLTVVPTGAAGGAEGPPAAAVSRPKPAPRPPSMSPNFRTLSHSRLLAVAAVLVLVIGGMGAILGGPLDPRSPSELSAIPAASFGTVEASPEPVATTWSVIPPQGTESAAGPAFIEDGLMYTILFGPGGSYGQVIDVGAGRPLWSSRLAETSDLNAAVWNGHLLIAGTGGPTYELFAFNGLSGEEAWSIPLAQRPVNLILDGNRAFVLGSGNLVSAIDLETRQQLWQTDLSSFDPDWEPYGGMNKFIYFDDGRLAFTTGVLGVVTTNGQLIALDADDGSQQWVDDRSTTGQTTLSVVAEQFVVTSVAPWDGTMEHDPFNIPPSPVADYDPRTQPCQRTFSARIDQTTEPVRDNGETIDSFDPLTGESLWGLRTHAAVWIYPADRDRLLGMIRPGWDLEIGNGDYAVYCAIDGRTGAVAETDGAEFVDIVMTDPETGAPVGLGNTYDALPVWVNRLDVQTATSFPRFDPDTESYSGPRFVQQTDDLVLITEQNGTVIALPKNGPRWTPLVDSPQTSWTVEPPVGISTSDRPLVIVNGVGLQTFISGMQSPVQAVDLSTGTVLWSELTPVTNDVIAASDDLFLIAGGDGASSGTTYHLVALDSRTGDERWRIELESRPVGLKVFNGRAFVLGSDNRLGAFELDTQQPLWQLDLRDLDPDRSDFGGANQFGDLTGDRLALTNGVLGVVVSNGRLAAVDATDGTLVWADERTTEGWTRVKVVDGKFVVIAFGGDTNVYDPDATPVPATPHDPAIDPCSSTIHIREGAAAQTAAGIAASVDAFDPETGDSPWGLLLPEQYFVWPLDDSSLIAQVESAESAGIADSADLINCRIDGSTGAVSEISGSSFATLVIRNEQGESLYAVGALPNGVTFWIGEVDPATAASLPSHTLDPDTFSQLYGGWRWVQEAAGLILITTQNGTLIGLPNEPEEWSIGVATPTASSSSDGTFAMIQTQEE